MAEIGTLRVNLATNVATFKREFDQAGSTVGRFGKAAKLGMAGVAAAATVATAAVAGIGAAIVTLGRRGSEISAVEGSFHRLTAAIGESGEEMIRMTRDATKGLISDFDIMQSANKALLLGIPVTSEGFAEMARSAVVLGRAMGQDAGKSLDDLITSLGRSSSAILDNLGLTVRAGEANEAYAAKLGKTVSELTDAERKTAFYEAALSAAKIEVERLGGIQLTFGDRLRMITTGMGNFVDAISMGIARSPALNAALEAIGESMLSAFGENKQDAVRTIVRIIDQAALLLAAMARTAVSGARIIGRVWFGLQAIFAGTFEAMGRVSEAVLDLLVKTVDLAASVPVLGRQYEDLQRQTRDTRDQVSAMTDDFTRQRREAVEGARGNSAYEDTLDRLDDALELTQARMQAASVAQEGVNDAVDESVPLLRSSTDAHNDVTSAVAKEVKEKKILTGIETRLNDVYRNTSKVLTDLIRTQNQLHLAVIESKGGFLDLDGTLNSSVTPTVKSAGSAMLDFGATMREQVQSGINKFREFNSFLTTVGMPGIGSALAQNVTSWTNWGLGVLDTLASVREHWSDIGRHFTSVSNAIIQFALNPLTLKIAAIVAGVLVLAKLVERFSGPGRPSIADPVPPFGDIDGPLPPDFPVPNIPTPDEFENLPQPGALAAGSRSGTVVNVDARGALLGDFASQRQLAEIIGRAVVGEAQLSTRFPI